MRHLAIPALALVLGMPGCLPDRAEAGATPGAPADSAEIVVHQPGRPRDPAASLVLLRVTQVSCSQPGDSEAVVYWQFHAIDGVGTTPAPLTIRYGSPPAGYAADVEPAELTPGCYEILVHGDGLRGRGRFRVSQESRIESE